MHGGLLLFTLGSTYNCKMIHPVHYNNYAPLIDLVSGWEYNKMAVIVDDNTRLHCLPLLEEHLGSLPVIEVPHGEKHKTIATCQQIWQQMKELQLNRKSLIINLGGGVVGDMGGFCAATYMRGVDFVQVPTTLLAQVDASVGGKIGVDLQSLKNLVGLIVDPLMVIIDSVYLQTLPANQLRSGYAEVLKHGLIADRSYWHTAANQSLQSINDWQSIIEHSVSIKSAVVEKDPREGGLRKVLNYGHTVGHAIETYHMDKPSHLLHGEAIAIGMIVEAHLSLQHGHLTRDALRAITDGIIGVFGHHPDRIVDVDSLWATMLLDKKNKSSQVLCTLLKDVGVPTFDQAITKEETKLALQYYLEG